MLLKYVATGLAVVLASAQTRADLTVQIDLNTLGAQALDANGAPTLFGGIFDTGSVHLSYVAPVSRIESVGISTTGVGPFADQGFNGQLTAATGIINLMGGLVVGGSLSITVNGGTSPDTYTAHIVPNLGHVAPYVNGGFTIEALSFNGGFDHSHFGNVNVAAFPGSALTGALLQFNFNPDATGHSFADMDVFAVVPAPGAAITLIAGGLLALGRRRR